MVIWSCGRAGEWLGPNGLVRPAGIEPATYGFEARRSIQLSYGRTTLQEARHEKICQGQAPTSSPTINS